MDNCRILSRSNYVVGELEVSNPTVAVRVYSSVVFYCMDFCVQKVMSMHHPVCCVAEWNQWQRTALVNSGVKKERWSFFPIDWEVIHFEQSNVLSEHPVASKCALKRLSVSGAQCYAEFDETPRRVTITYTDVLVVDVMYRSGQQNISLDQNHTGLNLVVFRDLASVRLAATSDPMRPDVVQGHCPITFSIVYMTCGIRPFRYSNPSSLSLKRNVK